MRVVTTSAMGTQTGKNGHGSCQRVVGKAIRKIRSSGHVEGKSCVCGLLANGRRLGLRRKIPGSDAGSAVLVNKAKRLTAFLQKRKKGLKGLSFGVQSRDFRRRCICGRRPRDVLAVS